MGRGEGTHATLCGGSPRPGRHWDASRRMNGPAKVVMASGGGNERARKAAAAAQTQFVAAPAQIRSLGILLGFLFSLSRWLEVCMCVGVVRKGYYQYFLECAQYTHDPWYKIH